MLCDEIRREHNGKFILIGVYSKEIIFPQLPSQFRFALWVEMDQPEAGEVVFGFRGVMKPTNYELFSMQADALIKQPDEGVTMAIGPIGVLIGGEGILSIQYRHDEEEWIEAREMPVRQRSSAFANAPQQPA